MNREELVKEAEESAKKFFGKPTDLVDLDNLRIFKNGYLAGAEPREKQIEEMKCCHKMDYNDKESCKKIPRCVQLLTEYDCGLFVAYCVNRWTGDHWEEHSYGITRWKEIE